MSAAYKISGSEFELFNAVPSPIVVTESNGAIIFANLEFEELINIDRQIIEGMCIHNLFPSTQKNKISATLAIANQQVGHFSMKHQTLQIRRKSRRQVLVDLSMAKYEVDGRKVVVFSFSDLSEIKSLESASRVRS